MEQVIEFLANHWFLTGTLVLLLALLFQSGSGKVVKGIETLTTQECVQKINKENAVLIDIRNADSFGGGHIVNSLNITLNDLQDSTKQIQKYKSKPIIVICAAGVSAIRAAQFLKEKQFNDTFVLKGGIQAWVEAELPLVN